MIRPFLVALPIIALAVAGCTGTSTTPPQVKTVDVQVVAIAVAPTTASLFTGGTQVFAAAVTGTANPIVNWSVQEGTSGGTISPGGAYTAPAADGTFHVVATSAADSTKTATATVTVTTQIVTSTLSVSPAAATVQASEAQTFAAAVNGATSTTVTWSVQEGSSGGSVTSDGVYTAPGAAGTFHVVATSAADTSISGTAVVTVVLPAPVVSVVVTPASASVEALQALTFSAEVTGNSNTSVTWNVQEGATGGSVTSAGVYTAPATAGTYHVVATSVADTTKTAAAAVTVAPLPVVVTVSPQAAIVSIGGSQSFAATVTGTSNSAVTWSVQEGAAGGSVTSSGVYTAPATAGMVHVVATSVADANSSATALVDVTVALVVSVSILPTTVNLAGGATQQFAATVSDAANTAVTWSVMEGASGGTITSTGLYTSANVAGTFHVVATSVADMTKSATAVVMDSGPPPITVSVGPSTATVVSGATQQFSATLTNATNMFVTWSVQEGASGGTVSTTGLFTAGQTAGAFHVVVTSQQDSTKFGAATVTVVAALPPMVTVSPAAANVTEGGTQQFTSTVVGPSNTAVNWTVMESGGGTIDGTGLYTAPSTAGVFHVVATSVAAPTVSGTATVSVSLPAGLTLSGTVSYSGSHTGPIYVAAQIGGSVNYGDGILSPGGYTIEGIPANAGPVNVIAFMDTLGTGAYLPPADPTVTQSITFGATSQTVNLTLADPAVTVLTAAPTGVNAFPSTDSAAVNWNTVQDMNGDELADHYKVYWGMAASTTACPATLASSLIVPNDSGHPAFVAGLTPGDPYCFAVSGLNDGAEGPISTVSGPVTIVAPSGASTFSLSGTVTLATTSTSGALFVVSFGQSGILYERIANPVDSQPFTITGLPTGKVQVAAFLDSTGDNEWDSADANTLTGMLSKAPPVVMVAGNMTGMNLTIPVENSVVTATTEYAPGMNPGSGYVVQFKLSSNAEMVASGAVVSGPNLMSAVDFGLDPNNSTGGQLRTAFSTGNNTPVVGQTYGIAVTYTHGSMEVLTPALTDVVTAAPTLTVPTGAISTLTPTFSWGAPSPAPASFTYSLVVNAQNGQQMWSLNNFPSTQTTADYNSDGMANPLQGGATYTWTVTVTDAAGSSSIATGMFSEQ